MPRLEVEVVKRTITAVFVIVLLLSLTVPTVAVGKRGGVPASTHGKGRAQDAAVAPAGEEGASEEAGEPAIPGRGLAKGAAKRAGSLSASEAEQGSDDAASDDEGAVDDDATSDETEDGTDAGGPAESGLGGIRNALSRLEANLARMQADFEAGKRKGLPPGLQQVIAKFMAWLGIGGDDEGAGSSGDDAATEDPGTGEEVGGAIGEDPGSGDDAVSDDPGSDDGAVGEDPGTGGEDPGVEEPGAGGDGSEGTGESDGSELEVPLALMSLLMR